MLVLRAVVQFRILVSAIGITRRAIERHKGSIRARNAHPGLEVQLELPVP